MFDTPSVCGFYSIPKRSVCGLNSECGCAWPLTRLLTQLWPLSLCLSVLRQLHVFYEIFLTSSEGWLFFLRALPGSKGGSLLDVARRRWSSLATGAFKCLQKTQRKRTLGANLASNTAETIQACLKNLRRVEAGPGQRRNTEGDGPGAWMGPVTGGPD